MLSTFSACFYFPLISRTYPKPGIFWSSRSELTICRKMCIRDRGSPAAPSLPSPPPEEPADPVEPAPTSPVSPPSQPAYSFNGSSYGRARSNNQGFYNTTPQAPPADPVTPPVQPDPPEIPENPVVPQPPVTPEPPPAGGEAVTLNPQEQQLFDLVNSERVSRGLAPLQLDAQLTYLARLKSQDMSDLNYFCLLYTSRCV